MHCAQAARQWRAPASSAGKTAGCVSLHRLSVSRQNSDNHVASAASHVASAASLQPRLGLLQENSMALCKYASTREQEMHSWENAYRSTRGHFLENNNALTTEPHWHIYQPFLHFRVCAVSHKQSGRMHLCLLNDVRAIIRRIIV
jgi:hypothetical protein